MRAFGGARLKAAGKAIQDYQTFFAPVKIGDLIAFSDPQAVLKFLPEGWSEAEPAGVWSEGELSVIALRMAKPLSDFRLIFDLQPFAGQANAQETSVSVNDRQLDPWLFETNERRSVEVAVSLPTPAERITIRLRHRRPASPHQLGVGDDKRRLAIFLHSLKVTPAR